MNFSRVICIAIALSFISQPAAAFWKGSPPIFAPVGNAQINLGGGQLNVANVFTNLFDASGYGFFNGATADVVNGDGFPNAAITSPAVIGGQFGLQSGLATTGPYKLNWDAGVSCFGLKINTGTLNVTSTTNATVTPSSGAATEVLGDCVHAGSITFTFSTLSAVNWTFDNSGTQPAYSTNTSGRMWMCRSTNVGWNGADDCTAYNNGIRWTTEFVNLLKSLKPQTIRTMGWDLSGPGQSSLATLWKYRGGVNKLSLSASSTWPTTARAGGGPGMGTITGSNGAYTSPAATDTDLTGWNTNGEWIIGDIQTASGGLLVSGITTGASCVVAVKTVPVTGTTHGNSTIDGIASTTGMYKGMPVYAADLPAGTVIAATPGANSITINTTATGSNTETVTGGTVTGITNGQLVSIFGIVGTTELNINDMTVTAVNSGANTFTVSTACSNAWVSGGQIGYQTLAITGKSGGSKPVMFENGFPIGISNDAQNGDYIPTGPAAFFYSTVTGHLQWAGPGTGVTTSVTPEAQIQLANLVNANLWWTYGSYVTDDYITQLGTLFFNTANSNLALKTEDCNEIWNGSFQCEFQMNSLGLGAGLFTTNTISAFSPYQAYRTLQVGQLLQPVFGGASHPRFKNLYMIQGGSGLGNFTQVAQMNGSSITAACPTCATFPNRPIDWTDAIGYAPYVSAPGLADGTPDTNVTPTVLDLPNLQTILDNYIAGNTSTAYAKISSLLADGQVGTQNISTASGNVFTTASPHGYSAGNRVEFGSTGGTPYSGLNPLTEYQVSATNLTTTNFSVNQVVNGAVSGSLANAGTVGTGTTTVGLIHSDSNGLFPIANTYFAKYQWMIANDFSPAPAQPVAVDEYEGSIELGAITAAHATAIGLVTPSNPATTTGTTHGTTVIDSIASLTNVFVGEVASAADITTGQLIVSINTGCPTVCTGNYVVLSAVATGSNMAESVTFTGTAALANSTMVATIPAWKNSSQAKASQQLYYNAFMGTATGYITTSAMPNSDAPSNLVLTGASTDVWALIPGLAINTTPYLGTFCGVQAFNGGSGSGC